MLNEYDLKTLSDAGVTDISQLIRAAATYFRFYPVHPRVFSSNTLSPQEEAFLKAGGAYDTEHPPFANSNVVILAAEFSVMAVTALDLRETADRLEVSMRRVRQRIANRTLYSIQGPDSQVCPSFQFLGNTTLPGFEHVLPAISPEANPVTVQRFFLTPSADLEPVPMGQALSPREWLLGGHPPEPVLLLAQELG